MIYLFLLHAYMAEIHYSKLNKHPIESLHAEFCENILGVKRKTPECRAEQAHIQKLSLKFCSQVTK